MDSISISQLKTNPSKAVRDSVDYPIAVESRNKIEAYIIGKDLYDRLMSFIEDTTDKKAIDSTDFSKGKDISKIEKELGL